MPKYLHPMNFRPQFFAFYPGKNLCLVDKYPYELSAPVAGGAVAACDALRMFSQKLYRKNDLLCSAEGRIPWGETVALGDIASLLGYTFRDADPLILSVEGPFPEPETLSAALENHGKTFGHLYRLFLYEPMNALIPVRLYVPQAVKTGAKIPMLVLLHGGGSQVDEPFVESHDRICVEAEERGILLLSADGCCANCSYGCKLMPEGINPAMIPAFTDNEVTLEAKQLTEDSVLARIRYYGEKYNCDPDRIYLQGNSMGGMGSFYLAQQHPDIFAGAAPSSAAPMADLFDTAPLADMPIYYTAGTEDDHGFCHLERAAKVFQPNCRKMIFHPVQGGTHGHCWVDTMDKWLPFLLSHRKGE